MSAREKSLLFEDLVTPDSPRDLGALLFSASEACDLPRVVSLLARGADAKLEWSMGSGSRHTPLTIALRSSHPDAAACAEALLPYSEPERFTSSGHDAISCAIGGGNVECVRALLPWIDAKKKTKTLSTPLHYAAWEGSPEIVQALIPFSDVSQKDGRGRSALELAVERGKAEAARVLIQAGADPSQVGEEDHPLLMMATHQGLLAVVEALLEGGADAKARLSDGTTALIIAAHRSSLEITERLIPYSDCSAVNELGENALMIFCRAANLDEKTDERRAALLAQACGLGARNKKGQSALDLAEWKNKPLVVQALRAHYAAEERVELETTLSIKPSNPSSSGSLRV